MPHLQLRSALSTSRRRDPTDAYDAAEWGCGAIAESSSADGRANTASLGGTTANGRTKTGATDAIWIAWISRATVTIPRRRWVIIEHICILVGWRREDSHRRSFLGTDGPHCCAAYLWHDRWKTDKRTTGGVLQCCMI